MSNLKKQKILIGIQARSTSQRLPNKSLKLLRNKPMLSWVVNTCLKSAKYLNRKIDNVECLVAILCPYDDEIATSYPGIEIIEGDEFDVLSRYESALRIHNPDYICRVTADCPLISNFILTNHIVNAIKRNYDYISNVDSVVRTEIDGRDIEVLSKRALLWLIENARTDEEKEHVTLKIRTDKPESLFRAHTLNSLDLSDLKISIDTEDEFIKVEKMINSFIQKRIIAECDVGIENVFFV